MAFRTASYAELTVGTDVVLSLRSGESIIVGSVTEETAGGGKRVTLKNNRNSVVIYEGTNFRIEADLPETAASLLDTLYVGEMFTYGPNKFGVTKQWVKTGRDRYTRVDDERPATSYSKAGFPGSADLIDLI